MFLQLVDINKPYNKIAVLEVPPSGTIADVFQLLREKEETACVTELFFCDKRLHPSSNTLSSFEIGDHSTLQAVLGSRHPALHSRPESPQINTQSNGTIAATNGTNAAPNVQNVKKATNATNASNANPPPTEAQDSSSPAFLNMSATEINELRFAIDRLNASLSNELDENWVLRRRLWNYSNYSADSNYSNGSNSSHSVGYGHGHGHGHIRPKTKKKDLFFVDESVSDAIKVLMFVFANLFIVLLICILIKQLWKCYRDRKCKNQHQRKTNKNNSIEPNKCIPIGITNIKIGINADTDCDLKNSNDSNDNDNEDGANSDLGIATVTSVTTTTTAGTAGTAAANTIAICNVGGSTSPKRSNDGHRETGERERQSEREQEHEHEHEHEHAYEHALSASADDSDSFQSEDLFAVVGSSDHQQGNETATTAVDITVATDTTVAAAAAAATTTTSRRSTTTAAANGTGREGC